MGCGGSRADAIIEPRYHHESWTRDTESTWLTNTDVDTPLPGNVRGLEGSLREKRMVNTGTQCGKQPLTTTGSNHQGRPRRSCNNQTARESKQRGSKEASAPSKDAQPVNNSSGGDTETRKDCDER